MIKNKVLLTQEGKEELERELDTLIHEKRAEASEKIKIARGFGDLSENAEYDEAKDEQAKIELRIAEIEEQLKNVEIIKSTNNKSVKTVQIGDKIKITELKRGKELEFMIVGTLEADVSKNKISNESPLGKALLNTKVGQTIDVKTRAGVVQYKLDEIIR
ncbi:transcription elongation factor GreA [uncultured Helcococcus sp.]|uniref:transcription elongation factor GreA n=1 Tax=uncultured Helcococcus sp. TaxID=1072508 RepID=UPI0026177F7C|nr:transcription elongation factor GreA [uncultured Helcococcus sp.]